ncbi:mechanosensitive ion channel family protein [Betaproteobacteria bacterium SCN2]|jgi:small conductance mechanosensitive channel|nr:mechanosensitive ion channel family protein [Betaproteobacteria bacterium SCN2]
MAIDAAPITQQLAALDQAQSKLIDLGIEFGPRLFVAILILIAGYYAGRWVGRMLDRMLTHLEIDLTARQLLVRIAHLMVVVLFLIMALQNLGVDLLPLIAGLGVAGAGIALAMQGVLSNLAAGLTIIFTRPYRVNEYISIAGEEGLVEAISLFNTTLSHPDLSRVVIPNRKIAGEILHNYGDIRQLGVDVGVAYDSDLNHALAAVDDVLRANPRVLQEPAPYVQVVRLADSSINIAVKPWVGVPDYHVALGELNKALVEAFRQRAIRIALPQREVRLLENP